MGVRRAGSVPLVAALFYGLKPAVVAIVLEASIRIGKRALKSALLVAIATAAFVGIAVLGVPFPLLVLAAGLTGFAVGRARPDLLGLARRTTRHRRRVGRERGVCDSVRVDRPSASRFGSCRSCAADPLAREGERVRP